MLPTSPAPTCPIQLGGLGGVHGHESRHTMTGTPPSPSLRPAQDTESKNSSNPSARWKLPTGMGPVPLGSDPGAPRVTLALQIRSGIENFSIIYSIKNTPKHSACCQAGSGLRIS